MQKNTGCHTPLRGVPDNAGCSKYFLLHRKSLDVAGGLTTPLVNIGVNQSSLNSFSLVFIISVPLHLILISLTYCAHFSVSRSAQLGQMGMFAVRSDQDCFACPKA